LEVLHQVTALIPGWQSQGNQVYCQTTEEDCTAKTTGANGLPDKVSAQYCQSQPMVNRIAIAGLACLLTAGCNPTTVPSSKGQTTKQTMTTDSIKIFFLTRDGCASTPILLANLKDVAKTGDIKVEYEVVSQDILPATDPRIGYPTPTILYNDRDIFGLAKPVAPFSSPG
jgi:hypothetical protein